MAINTLAFAEKMTEELDRAVVQRSVTGFWRTNALRSKFVGAQTVLVPEMEVSGLGKYDRYRLCPGSHYGGKQAPIR